jgi:DNA-binding helix-hairpin-helix protein with protein kinase domain
MKDFFNESGQRILLGNKLGSGGEGEVYEVQVAGKEFAAKIYHHPLKQEKQAKLRGMVQGCDEGLGKISAWPLATLHQNASGPIRGFLMPKVVGFEPIHVLYNPSHRKQSFPYADWAFLINAARNVAAVFEIIHSHGHVVGDVNQGNIFVAANSIVKLIDCDSFQITAAGKHYLCEVGVGHFSPPELQAGDRFMEYIEPKTMTISASQFCYFICL